MGLLVHLELQVSHAWEEYKVGKLLLVQVDFYGVLVGQVGQVEQQAMVPVE